MSLNPARRPTVIEAMKTQVNIFEKAAFHFVSFQGMDLEIEKYLVTSEFSGQQCTRITRI